MRVQLLLLLESSLTIVAAYAAATFFLIAAAALAEGVVGPFGFFPLFPGVGIRMDAVFIFSLVFLTALVPRYGRKSVWTLGLIWGAAELVWNVEIAAIDPDVIRLAVTLAAWWVYMAGVASFFGASAFMLKRQLERGRPQAALVLAILLYTPVHIAVATTFFPGSTIIDVSAAQVLTTEVPWYALITTTVFLGVRRRA